MAKVILSSEEDGSGFWSGESVKFEGKVRPMILAEVGQRKSTRALEER